MRRCLSATRQLDHPRHCRQHLTATQAQRLDEALAAIDPELPPRCRAYEQLLAHVATCGALSQPDRDALAGQLAAARHAWADLPERMSAACGAAIIAVKQAAAACPGIQRW
jgi:hypothetical protein